VCSIDVVPKRLRPDTLIHLSVCMVIVIIYILGGYADGFYGYYSARPARCGTLVSQPLPI